MSLFCFDFGGCGMSEGEFVSLGHFEKEDISTVIKYIYCQKPTIHIVLWGRSMGAAASILYSFSNPHLTAMVLDSPFANFSQVADEMVSDYKIVPKFVRKYLIKGTAQYIKENYNFDIMKLNPISFVRNCKIPTIFIHSFDDKLVRIEHSKELYELFKGPKCFMEISGEHNTVRDKVVVMKALKIVLYLIGKCQKEEQEMATSRDHFPEFNPNLAEIIRHRRGESEGNILN
jgi:alpha/beta superfamily hydrolase